VGTVTCQASYGVLSSSAHRSSIEDVDNSRHILPLEVARECIGLQHTTCHVDDALVALLHHPVLLQRIGGSELALNVALGVVPPELNGCELPSLISAEGLDLSAFLSFN
jgi:hypothetical protein